MKLTKKNGNITLYDDEKIIRSILRANEEVPGEKLTRKKAAAISDLVFLRLTEEKEIITTADIRSALIALLIEKGYPQTAAHYQNYKKD